MSAIAKVVLFLLAVAVLTSCQSTSNSSTPLNYSAYNMSDEPGINANCKVGGSALCKTYSP
jgi:predicted component of type VI protein secretion system